MRQLVGCEPCIEPIGPEHPTGVCPEEVVEPNPYTSFGKPPQCVPVQVVCDLEQRKTRLPEFLQIDLRALPGVHCQLGLGH